MVPCHNVAPFIGSTLQAILEQTQPPYEVILVENHSTDGTLEVLRWLAAQAEEVRVIVGEDPNADKRPVSVAMNAGILAARGDVVVRVDADTLLRPDALGYITAPMDHAVATAANVRLSNPRDSLWTACQAIEYYLSMELDRRSQLLYNSVMCCSGALTAFDRKVLVKIGGYDLHSWVSEDMEITLRIHQHGRIAMAPEARCYTDVPKTFVGLVRQRYRWARAGATATWMHKRAVGSRRYGLGVGLIGMPLRILSRAMSLFPTPAKLALAAFSHEPFLLAFAVVSVLHGGIIAFEMLVVAPVASDRQGLSYLWLVLPFTLIFEPVLSVVNAAGTLRGLLFVMMRRV